MFVFNLLSWAVKRICLFLGIVFVITGGLMLFGSHKIISDDQFNKEINRIIKKCSPTTQEYFNEIRERRSTLGLASELKARYNLEGVNGLETLARAPNKDDLMGILTDIAVEKLRDDGTNTTEDFLLAHYLTLEDQSYLSDNPTFKDEKVKREGEYLDVLRQSKDDYETWIRVRENPVYVLLLLEFNNSDSKPANYRELLNYYEEEKDWLDKVLGVVKVQELSFVDSEDFADYTANDVESFSLSDVLTVVKENHPYLRDVLKQNLNLENDTSREDNSDNNENAEGVALGVCETLSLFWNYGKAIKIVTEKGIPIEETLSVLWGNDSYFGSIKDENELSAKLLRLWSERKDVWHNCTNHAYLLETTEFLEPDSANRVCQNYAAYDIGIFLVTQYPDALRQAARAIDKYGDLAYAVLTQYSGSEKFHKYLKDNELGVRIIPYAARYEDKGLDRIADNKKWVDKYFDEDGNEKEKGWVEDLPGGGIYTVAKNWCTGAPNTWSEIGWGALDVVDAVTIIATIGTSSAVSSTVKEGVKKSAQQAAQRSAARITTKELTEVAINRSLKNPVIYRTLLSTAQKTIKITKRICKTKLGRVILLPFRCAQGVYDIILKPFARTAKNIYGTWNKLPQKTKRTVYKAIIASCILTELIYKTIPRIEAEIQKMMNNMRELSKKILDAAIGSAHKLAEGITEQAKKILVPDRWVPAVTIFLGLLLILINVFIGKSKQTTYASAK